MNTKIIKDYYKRSQDNLTSGQFAPNNFVSLDNFVLKKNSFFLRRGMFINAHSLVLREILLYNMKIFKGNIGGTGGARCPR